MARIVDQFYQIAEPIVLENGLELVDVEYVKEGSEWFLRVFIDKEGGVDIDDCTKVSRGISEVLEDNDPIEQAYHLEVSSPGIERPLRKTEDFEKFMGHKVLVKTFTKHNGKKEFIGYLSGIDDENIRIDIDGQEEQVPRELVSKSSLVWEE